MQHNILYFRYIVTTVTLDTEEGEGHERLILNQVAEKDMKHKLDSQTVFTGKDDLMTMTITIYADNGEEIVGVKKYIRHMIYDSHNHSGTVSPKNGVVTNGRHNSLVKGRAIHCLQIQYISVIVPTLGPPKNGHYKQ